MKKKNLTVIGSVALDTITTPAGEVRDVLGGSCVYFSLSASFFTRTNIVATAGEDFPQGYINLISSFGIDTSGLEIRRGKTFRWEGSYLDDLNCAKTINTQLNVFKDFRPVIPPSYRKSKFVFLANIDPELQMFIVNKFPPSSITGCDSMNYWIANKKRALRSLMKKVDFVFLNDSEARMFSQEKNILRAGKYILSLGTKFVIIKRGEYGAVLFCKGDIMLLAPAFMLETVRDPTGAGDSFAGGFMGHLSRTKKLDEKAVKNALLYGSVMASFAVEDFSVNRFKGLKRREIEKRYNKLKKITMVE